MSTPACPPIAPSSLVPLAGTPLPARQYRGAERAVVIAGTLSHAPTPHRIGPAWDDAMVPHDGALTGAASQARLARLILPVLQIDGAVLGLSRPITFVHSQFRGGQLRYTVDARGRLRLDDASRAALFAWHDVSVACGNDVWVDGVRAWKAPFLALTAFEVDGPPLSAAAATTDLAARPAWLPPTSSVTHRDLVVEAWRRDLEGLLVRTLLPAQPHWTRLPLLWIPEPLWLQGPEPPAHDAHDGPLAFIGQLDPSRLSDEVIDTDLYLYASAATDRIAIVGQAS